MSSNMDDLHLVFQGHKCVNRLFNNDLMYKVSEKYIYFGTG